MHPVVRRQLTRSATVAALLGTAALAGCGGDDRPEAVVSPSPVDMTASVKVELARGIYKENDPGGDHKPLVSGDAARCIAADLLTTFSVQDLMNIGVLDNTYVYAGKPESVPVDEATTWVGSFEKCLDLNAYMLGVTRAGVEQVAPKYGTSDADWAKAATCVEGADPQAAHAVMMGAVTAKPKDDAHTRAFITCVQIAYPDATF